MNQRQAIISAAVDPSRARMLEIGALDAPTFAPDRHDIRFVDYASKEQLLRDYPNNPRFTADRLVNVDYPVPSPEYSKFISERFDLVIANHVIEHVPDTIRWLEELRTILDEGGHVFLSIPDRRYTFDYLRQETTIGDVLRAYYGRAEKPGLVDIFEHMYYFRVLNAADAWDGKLHEKIAVPRQTIQEAMANAQRLAKRPYASVHCHVYTYDSFLKLIAEARQLNLVRFEIVQSHDVQRGRNEFHVLLRRT